jgi:hypothetical protein
MPGGLLAFMGASGPLRTWHGKLPPVCMSDCMFAALAATSRAEQASLRPIFPRRNATRTSAVWRPVRLRDLSSVELDNSSSLRLWCISKIVTASALKLIASSKWFSLFGAPRRVVL